MYEDKIYYEDQRSWTPADFYALFRYLNRLFLNPRESKVKEIQALDLGKMSAETRYLMKHLLIQKRAYARIITRYPNLKGLDDIPDELGKPLYLTEEPLLVFKHLTEKGIYL